MDLKESHILNDQVEQHWYYHSKMAAIKAYTKSLAFDNILDIGAGSGFFARSLLIDGQAKAAVCVDPNYDNETNEQVDGRPLQFRKQVDVRHFELFLLMDVLEHVEDDVGLLLEYSKHAPAESYFLISVPAFNFLWSGHDEFLEHYRRYTLSQLKHVAINAGLKPTTGSYYFGLVFPLAVVSRIVKRFSKRSQTNPKSQLKQHHPLVNGVLKLACRAELPLLKHNRIICLTAFLLAKKSVD